MTSNLHSTYFGDVAPTQFHGRQALSNLHHQMFLGVTNEEMDSSDHSNDSVSSTISKSKKRKNPLKKLQKLLRPSLRKSPPSGTLRRMSGPYAKATPSGRGVVYVCTNKALDFLTNDCPEDILPTILAFAGPKIVSALSRTNKQWKSTIDREATWKVMSMEMCKWKEGDALPKSTWKSFYQQNPCVPVDYRSVHNALSALSASKIDGTIWLRPGLHILRESLNINMRTTVTIKTMKMPACYDKFRCFDLEDDLMGTRATLSRETYRRNQSLMHIYSGKVVLEDVNMHHHCAGTNLWGGNSVLHLEPNSGCDVSLALDNVDLTSSSGRGIVATGGSQVTMSNSYLHECASAGIYVSGSDTTVSLKGSDIVGNGRGSHTDGFIPNGHSGIFVLDGNVDIQDCNVSYNMGAGISIMDANNTRASCCLRITEVHGNLGGPMEFGGVIAQTTTSSSASLLLPIPTATTARSGTISSKSRTRTKLMKDDDSFDGPQIVTTAMAAIHNAHFNDESGATNDRYDSVPSNIRYH